MKIVKEFRVDGKVTAVEGGEHGCLYAGVGTKLYEITRMELLHTFEKSIRIIRSNGNFLGCGSNDRSAVVFDVDEGEHRKIETIVGPETEIIGLDSAGDLLAVSTRGKTVWIFKNFEILEILEDHTQEIKGCRFIEIDEQKNYRGFLLTWSYDETIKVYEIVEHEFHLIQSISCHNSIVRNVLVIDEQSMVALLHSGEVVLYEWENGERWKEVASRRVSLYPIYTSCCYEDKIGIISNRNVLVIINKHLDILFTKQLHKSEEILSLSILSSPKNNFVYGTNQGEIFVLEIESFLEVTN